MKTSFIKWEREREREFNCFGIEVADFHICTWMGNHISTARLIGNIFLLDTLFPSFIYFPLFSFTFLMIAPCCVSPILVDGLSECIYTLICPYSSCLLALDPMTLLYVSLWCFPIDSNALISLIGFSVPIPLHPLLHHLCTSPLGKCCIIEIHVKYS